MAEAPRRVGRCLLAGRERRRSLFREKKKKKIHLIFLQKSFYCEKLHNIFFFKPNLSLVARHSSLVLATILYPTMMMTTFHPPTNHQSLFLWAERKPFGNFHTSLPSEIAGLPFPFDTHFPGNSPCPVPKFLCNLNCKRNRKKKKKKQAVGENCVACAITQFLQAYPLCVRIKSKC